MRIYHADCIGQEFNCLYPHAADITDAPSLAAAVRRDYVCAEYKGSYRSNDNFLRSDCLAADFDNDHSEDPADWVKPEDILSAFPGVAVGFHFSRHHLKPKDSFSARPRFHVLLAIEPVTDQAEYAAMKKQLAVFFPQVDPKALDAARFFFGTENPVVEFHPGDKKLNDYLSDFDAGMAKGTYGDRVIKEGSRNATLSRFGGRLAMRFGWNDRTHGIFLQEAEKCDPPLEEDELEKIWKSCRKFARKVARNPEYIPPEAFNAAIPQGPAGSLKPQDYSDIGQAKVVKQEYGNELAYHPGTDYLMYDGVCWQENKEKALGAVEEFLDLQLADAQLLVMATRETFLNAGGSEDALSGSKKATAGLGDRMMKLRLEYLSAKTYEAFVMQRRNMKWISPTMNALKPMVGIEIDQLNHDPLLLNTPTATYDLRLGLDGRREHRAEDFCTKVTAVDPGDEGRELWLDALNKTFRHDQELIDYHSQGNHGRKSPDSPGAKRHHPAKPDPGRQSPSA